LETKVFSEKNNELDPGSSYKNSFKLWELGYIFTSIFFLIGSIGLVTSICYFGSTLRKLDLKSSGIEN